MNISLSPSSYLSLHYTCMYSSILQPTEVYVGLEGHGHVFAYLLGVVTLMHPILLEAAGRRYKV